MAETFSFDIEDRDALLSQHHEISKTSYNVTPVKRQSTLDTEREERRIRVNVAIIGHFSGYSFAQPRRLV